MIRGTLLSSIALLAGSALLVQAAPKDDVTSAVRKLADIGNYSWKSTTETGGGGQFRPGPIEGKTEKDGFTMLSITRGEETTEIVLKGERGAIKTADGWKSLEEAAQAGGDQPNPARFLARMARSFRLPAAQAQDLLANVRELKEAEGALAGELTEEGARSLMTFGRGGANAPEISGAKGSVKFWIKDGVLSKFEYRVQGKVTFNNNEREVDRTTTVEIKDVASTKVNVPEDAKKQIP